MNATSTTQRLTAREAEALWRAWSVKKDKAARDRLVLAYSPMVKYLASRKVRELPSHCELDDLVSYGLVALIAARSGSTRLIDNLLLPAIPGGSPSGRR